MEKGKLFDRNLIFALGLAAVLSIALIISNMIIQGPGFSLADYTEGWTTGSGDVVDVDEIKASFYGGHVILSKKLPDKIVNDDELCFIASNISYIVYIEDVPIKAYDQKENITGRGYGTSYHTVGLTPEQGGKTVRIDMRSVFRTGGGGQIRMITVENGQSFRARMAAGMIAPFIISVSIVFIGILLLVFRLALPKRSSYFGVVPLGIMAVIGGIWLANDTCLFRLLFGMVRQSRELDYIGIHLWLIPFLFFVYTVTTERRKLFKIIALIIPAADVVFTLIMRIIVDKDMSSLMGPLVSYYVASIALIVVMLVSDRIYCRKNGIRRDIRVFFFGALFAVICTAADLAVYLTGVRSVAGRGTFARVGFCTFFILMALEAVRAYSSEQTSIRRDRFINKILQYAVSNVDPDVSIKAIIEQFGKEYEAERVFIYEKRNDSTFHNTYEWFKKGVSRPENADYRDLPYYGLVDELYDVFMKEHRLIVDHSEKTKKLNSVLYGYLDRLHIGRMAVGPLEYNGELIGLFGVDDAPVKKSEEIAEIIWLLSYFVSQLMIQRDEKRNLERLSYVDSLTGAHNRRSLDKFEEENAGQTPYGYIMCDINGLKQVNDSAGHEAGDKLIVGVAESLMYIFGAENVFRLGGDEFAVYSFVRSEREFRSLIENAHELIRTKGYSASIGGVFVTDPQADRRDIREKADALMYEEKEHFYKGRKDRRR